MQCNLHNILCILTQLCHKKILVHLSSILIEKKANLKITQHEASLNKTYHSVSFKMSISTLNNSNTLPAVTTNYGFILMC